MDDLVSKNLALEAIESIRGCIWDVDIPSPTVPEYVEHHEQMQMLMRKCDAWLSIIEREHATQPEQRWIPVSEKLPEQTGKYLVTVKNGNVYATAYSVMEKKFNCAAVAWMDLPEPYKEEHDEKA